MVRAQVRVRRQEHLREQPQPQAVVGALHVASYTACDGAACHCERSAGLPGATHQDSFAAPHRWTALGRCCFHRQILAPTLIEAVVLQILVAP
jgi:hypothetical protein